MKAPSKTSTQPPKNNKLLRKALSQWELFVMVIPCIILVVIFYCGPMYGWFFAFQDYKPTLGLFGSKFVGLKHFKAFFGDPAVGRILRNTVAMSFMNIVAHSVLPLLLALMINEVGNKYFKSAVQTLTYLPHFISFVVVSNIFLELLGSSGPVNEFLTSTGLLDKPSATIYGCRLVLCCIDGGDRCQIQNRIPSHFLPCPNQCDKDPKQ